MNIPQLIAFQIKILLIWHELSSIIQANAANESQPDLHTDCELAEEYAFVVLCTNMNSLNVGRAVDNLARPIVPFGPTLNLELRSIKFPDGVMGSNWYSGNISLYLIYIELDDVTVIEDNAFNVPALRTVYMISFLLKSFTEFKGKMFSGLELLEILTIIPENGAYFSYSNDKLLDPIYKTLKMFINLNFNATFKDTFGRGGYRRFALLEVAATNPRFNYIQRILSADDFSSLFAIRSLLLTNCGIEAISDHTFDYIGETLSKLDLSGNNLKHITIDLFYKFFDSSKFATNIAKIIALPQNLECNCDIYLVRNVTLINFGHSIQQDESIILCNDNGNLSNIRCDDAQLLYPKKFHLMYKGGEVFAYLNYQLKFNQINAELIVRQFKKRRYRLWIHSLNDRTTLKCPQKTWLEQFVNCYSFTKFEELIPIKKHLMNSDLTIFCIVYLQYPRKVWPLHCATIAKSIIVVPELWMVMENVVWIVSLLSFSCFFVGFSVIFAWSICREYVSPGQDISQPNNDQPQSTKQDDCYYYESPQYEGGNSLAYMEILPN